MTESPVKDCELNLTMLKNVVECAEAQGWALQHVYTMEGTKYYGQQYQVPLKPPFNEDDARHLGPNFYYDLEDYLRGRVAEGAAFAWSALRPNPVMGFSTGSYMSLLPSIGVYGSICKELGLEMRFPGTMTAYTETMEVTNADLLAQAMLFTATSPPCANQAFNINNGDFFRWDQLWPAIADFFGVKPGYPLAVGDLGAVMAGYQGVWEALVKRHGLKDVPYDKLTTWSFMQFVCQMPAGGWFSNTAKLRRTGFDAMVEDTRGSVLKQLQALRDARVIP